MAELIEEGKLHMESQHQDERPIQMLSPGSHSYYNNRGFGYRCRWES